MKNLKLVPAVLLLAAAAFVASGVRAADTNSASSGASPAATAKPKPDLLKICPVSGDKLGGDMGDPYVFTYQGQEVKLCCSMCKAKFDKDPAKFMKQIRAADDKPKNQPQP
jgi:YHS domain-containing protein